ncbi:L,D-transpeptidase [Brucella abortus]|nr:L,D-transpeptidase [Brucella abortus]
MRPAVFSIWYRPDGKARRYGVGVGKQGVQLKGTQRISRKAEWPTWTPPSEMIARERKKGRFPARTHGWRDQQSARRPRALSRFNPLPHPWHQPAVDHAGKAMSSGCIRMRNEM